MAAAYGMSVNAVLIVVLALNVEVASARLRTEYQDAMLYARPGTPAKLDTLVLMAEGCS